MMRRRLLVSHVVLALVVALASSFAVYAAVFLSEDLVFGRLLDAAADGEEVLHVFAPGAEFDADVAAALAEGERAELERAGRELHVLRAGETVYMVDMAAAQDEPLLVLGLIAGTALSVLLAVALAWLVARRVLAPVEDLARAFGGPEPVPAGFSRAYADDEVGHLARRMDEHLTARDAALHREQAFLRDASHELRTPLATMQGTLEMMAPDALPDDEALRRRVARLERGVRRMQGSVESLLWLAREEARARDVDLAAGVRELAETAREALPDAVAVRAHVAHDARLPEPAGLWLIAVGNLLDNAVKHTRAGSIDVEVDSRRIAVRDTGAGMVPALVERATQPWTHGDGAPGHGLGLDIVRRVASRLGWSVAIESEEGRGTEVVLAPAGGAGTESATVRSQVQDRR